MKVFLGLGSNVGDKIDFITKAIEEIKKLTDTKLIAKSSLYETEPWGLVEQDDFVNCVVEIETKLKPDELFSGLKSIEKKLFRKERRKWEQREIDIDILFYGDNVIHNDLINIPHREIENRNFVLIPMAELDAEFIHPEHNKSIGELIINTKDSLQVKKIVIER
ncbi:MAG TPA: 2-amino-4-hydroxy-6-hydroxymethyldihydropteridine diphosphokinase [Ignavibacteria bacterium]|nr:2-amino-4-hydroxy-6-hydroxymethyldihydropteridine diphosphokinase [Ignavibacteria bacterium]